MKVRITFLALSPGVKSSCFFFKLKKRASSEPARAASKPGSPDTSPTMTVTSRFPMSITINWVAGLFKKEGSVFI